MRLCSNYCTLESNCDAFFMEERAGAGNCHLVSETSSAPRTVGYGQDTDNVYYVKRIVSSVTRTTPDALIPPCDTDYSELTDDQCSKVLAHYISK